VSQSVLEIRPYSDATRLPAQGECILAHVLSDALHWGMGFTQALEERWPHCTAAFSRLRRELCLPLPLGEVLWTQATPNVELAHLVAEHVAAARPASLDLVALGRCLEHVAQRALSTGAVVHAPPLGTGLSAGRWRDVQDLLLTRCVHRGVPVVIHCLGGKLPA
jgi:hypothetical protein